METPMRMGRRTRKRVLIIEYKKHNIMQVDFTKKNEKTNIEYLREMLKTNMSDSYRPEAEEWLDAIAKEMAEKQEKIDELEDMESDNEVDTGNGLKESLKWSCPNLQIHSLMETLEDQLGQTSPLEIERRIKG